MEKTALENLRESMRKGATLSAATTYGPMSMGGSTTMGGALGSLWNRIGLGGDFGRLALYNQAQALKAKELAKQLSKYKTFGKVGGGALGLLALMALTGNLGLGGRGPQINPPTIVRYGD